MTRHETNVADALEWSQTEEHARKLIKSMRHSIAVAHATIAFAEADAANALVVLNAIKAQMYHKGWTE